MKTARQLPVLPIARLRHELRAEEAAGLQVGREAGATRNNG